MEVGYSAKSECYGAFERRRETLTMADFKAEMADFKEEFNKRMNEMDQKMDQIIQAMWQ